MDNLYKKYPSFSVQMHGLSVILFFFLFMIPIVLWADDTDVYRANVKSNAMLTIDVSGSMAWPVYDHELDYEAYYDWAISNGYAYDDGGLGNIVWDKNKIYLVSAYIGYAEITGEDGVTKYSVTGDPVYTGSTRRQRWVTGGIIYTGWEITDWENMTNNIETVTSGTAHYVIYPTIYDDSGSDNPTAVNNSNTVAYAHSNIAGERLMNHQDILLSDNRTDSRTGVTKDYGFLGYLKAPGIYFAGIFETGAYYTMTDDPADATTSSSLERVYAFVTGNYLSFIKVIEDLQGSGSCSGPAWEDLCYQTSSRVWQTVNIGEIKNSQYGYDYSQNRDEVCGTIDLSQYAGRKDLKIYFSTMDVENSSGSGGCSCWNHNSDNDGVILMDESGNLLKQINELIDETADGELYGCDTAGWTGEYDVSSVDTITVKFHTASNGANNCNGTDSGFKITRFKWTAQEAETDPIGGVGTFSCCNGDDGVGVKIQSRLDVAKEAMKIVIDETIDKINWGLVSWSGNGISLREQMGASADDLKASIDALYANGGTPMGEAMQDTYDWMHDFLSDPANQAVAACSENYMVIMTDGFPSGDNSWSRIDRNNGDPTFTYSDYNDGDSWTGDPTQTTEPNYSDDVARWMARGKCGASSENGGYDPDYNVISHTIGLGLDSPLLEDTSEEGCGISLVANNKSELVNAFYSLGLAMEPSVSFTAPVVSVDETNRTESGNDLYMAFFKPQLGDHWQGNLKKYGLAMIARTECGRNYGEWTVVDKNGDIASYCNGQFKPATISFWSTSNDGGVVNEGGVGGMLKMAVDAADMSNDPYAFRKIYTSTDGATLVPFTPDNLSNIHLDVTSDEDRYKTINFSYGYTYAVDTDGQTPVDRRTWILGDIVHSQPTIIEYTHPNGTQKYRFIAVGANDGMLHIFTDETYTINGTTYLPGEEIFAFIPTDVLPKLKNIAQNTDHIYTVDGPIKLFRDTDFTDTDGDGVRGTNEYYYKTLIFGERRGGTSYWALDVTKPSPTASDWPIKWKFTNSGDFSELGQSWSAPLFTTIRLGADPTTETYIEKDVMIFTGGYDPLEDSYPEDFTDEDYDGVWDSGETFTDTTGGTAGTYDIYNPGTDTMGRGIFVADADDGSLVFSATYGSSDVTVGSSQTYRDMVYCFPATPTLLQYSERKLYLYAADIYGQVWKVAYDYDIDDTEYTYPSNDSQKWSATKIFTANPGSTLASGDPNIAGASIDTSDVGRKTFYSPDYSVNGNSWTSNNMLYFGTGDREHPKYGMVSNRFYALEDTNTLINETDLLNLTCNEMDEYVDINNDGTVDEDDETLKDHLECLFRNDRRWDDTMGNEGCKRCESFTEESDCTSPCVWNSTYNQCESPSIYADRPANGFFRILDQQGSCSGVTGDDHSAEKVLSETTLFYGNVYFTTFQPVYDDPCNPNGNAYVYALTYDYGTAALNYNYLNDEYGSDLSDTYRKFENVSIPSGVRILIRGGKPAAFFSAGGGILGVGDGDEDENDYTSSDIPGNADPVRVILWETD